MDDGLRRGWSGCFGCRYGWHELCIEWSSGLIVYWLRIRQNAISNSSLEIHLRLQVHIYLIQFIREKKNLRGSPKYSYVLDQS